MEELDKLIHTYYRALYRDPSLVYKKPRQDFITVYGKEYCPYCRKAHEVIHNHPNAMYIELEEGFSPNSYAHMPHIEASNTIPIVFVNDEYIGGLDELQKILEE